MDIGYGYKQSTTFKEVATSNSNSLKLVTLIERKKKRSEEQKVHYAESKNR